MNVVGIDPGKQGASCRLKHGVSFDELPLKEDGSWDPWKMGMLAEDWKRNDIHRVVIEECHAFPGISAAANSAVMEGFGLWCGAIAQHFLPGQVVIVPAHVWKKSVGVIVPLKKAGKKATAEEKAAAYALRKEAAVLKACELFDRRHFYTPRGRALDGRADAALIAYYGRNLP